MNFKLEEHKQDILDSKVISLDIEYNPNSHVNDADFREHFWGTGLSYFAATGEIQAFWIRDLDVIQELLDFVTESEITVCGHYFQSDVVGFKKAGFTFKKDLITHCTAVMFNLLNDEFDDKDLGLKTLSKTILKQERSTLEENCGYGPDSPEFTQYAKQDVIDQLTLHKIGSKQLKEEDLYDVYLIITKSIIPFSDMTYEGMGFSMDEAEELYYKFGVLSDEIERNIYRIIGKINLASPKQLSNRLFKELKYFVGGLRKNSSGGLSTDIKNIEKLALKYPACELLSAHRSCAKAVSTYIEPFVEQYQRWGRTYDVFQLTSRTGRTRTKRFQLIPNDLGKNIIHNQTLKAGLKDLKLRRMFVPKEGHSIISADLSSAEYRYCAVVADDPKMIKMYRTYDCKKCSATGESKEVLRACPKCGCSDDNFKHGRDLHAFMRDVCNKYGANIDRNQAKAVSFCIIFNGTPKKLAIILNLPEDKCLKIQRALLDQFPGLDKWQQGIRDQVAKASKAQTKIIKGQPTMVWEPAVVYDYFGRRRKVDVKERLKFSSPDWAIKQAENELINFGCQSPVCIHVQIAMRNFRSRMIKEGLWGKANTICMVHDQLDIECPDELISQVSPILQYEMENAVDLEVPTPSDIKTAKTWADCK